MKENYDFGGICNSQQEKNHGDNSVITMVFQNCKELSNGIVTG